MKELTYIPFGAQYYRAPTPLPQDWEKDLTAFRDQGFNTIKIWAQWGWNMPEKDVFDFDDLDKLMDLSAALGLKVIINVIYDVAPHWFYREYPESLMVTADGRLLHAQSTAWRQIGGAPGPCLHHPEGIESRRRFTQALAERYAKHAALLCWDLWNEPELTCGIARDPYQENMVCYCDHSVKQFRVWLREKYHTLEEVNRRWGRCYRAWEDIQPPRYSRTYNDMIDWRKFFVDTLAEELRMRAQAIRSFDTGHSVMIHSVPGFDFVNTCAEDYLLAKEMDWYGNSDGSNPFPAACTTSAAKGKWVINAEIHAIGGNTMARPQISSFDDIKRHVMVPFGRGIKGYLFWQYKPECLGWEAPAWGLTKPDGGYTPQLEYTVKVNNALQANSQRLLHAFPGQARIAVVRSGVSEVFLWGMCEGKERLHRDSVEGAFLALYEANYGVDIVTEYQIAEDGLDDYDVVYYPLPYYVEKATAEVLRAFVARGGTLISEALFGGFNSENNLHAATLPGYGFDTVFGCVEDQTLTASVFRNAYEGSWANAETERESVRLVNAAGQTAHGYYFRQSFLPTTAIPIAWYENGEVAATVNRYGEGKAIIVGTCPGFMAGKYGDADSRAYIAALVREMAGQTPCAAMTGGRRCDILYRENKPEAVILQWQALTGRQITFTDAQLFGKTLTNVIDGTTVPVDKKGVGRIPDLQGRVEMYLVD